MRKVLIANRGEIAVRIARACDDAGLQTVAMYADVDADAVHVSAASEAYSLDGSRPADSYLNTAKILKIAARSGADAVHPGYGFLSEDADFAQAVLDRAFPGGHPAAGEQNLRPRDRQARRRPLGPWQRQPHPVGRGRPPFR